MGEGVCQSDPLKTGGGSGCSLSPLNQSLPGDGESGVEEGRGDDWPVGDDDTGEDACSQNFLSEELQQYD